MTHPSIRAFTWLALSLVPAALGQDTTPSAPVPTSTVTTEDGKLSVSVTPYFWALSVSGDATIRGVQNEVDGDFSALLENADRLYGFMGALDVRYERFVFQFNAAWAHVGESEVLGSVGAVTTEADLDSNMTWLELATGYRLIDEPLGEEGSTRRFTLDGLVGGRYTNMNADIDVTATAQVTLPGGEVLEQDVERGLDGSKDWFEPFIGARASLDISERWTLAFRGDIGGFGAESDFAWQTLLAMGYRFELGRMNATAFLGYRALGQDYSEGDFAWDAVAHGPMLGLRLDF